MATGSLTRRVFLPQNGEVAEIRPYGESSVVAQARLFPLTTGAFFYLQTSVTTLRWCNCARGGHCPGFPSSAYRLNPQRCGMN